MNIGSPEPLLSDLNLQLPANQLGLIYGRSGAGKTTLLQLLAGLTESSSGLIRLGVGTHKLTIATSLLCQEPACSHNGKRSQSGCSGLPICCR